MSLIKTPLEKAQGTREAAERRVADFRDERSALQAKLDAETDFDANLALREDLDRLDRKIAAAEVALASAEAQLAVEEEKARDAEGDRRHAAAQAKLVPAHEKVTLEIEALIGKLKAKFQESEALREQIAAANESRGHRPIITDGESKLRGKPARTEPPVYETREAYLDGAGNEPFRFRRNAQGEDVPEEVGYEKKRVQVQVRAERFVPPECPDRYAQALRLVDRSGRPILLTR